MQGLTGDSESRCCLVSSLEIHDRKNKSWTKSPNIECQTQDDWGSSIAWGYTFSLSLTHSILHYLSTGAMWYSNFSSIVSFSPRMIHFFNVAPWQEEGRERESLYDFFYFPGFSPELDKKVFQDRLIWKMSRNTIVATAGISFDHQLATRFNFNFHLNRLLNDLSCENVTFTSGDNVIRFMLQEILFFLGNAMATVLNRPLWSLCLDGEWMNKSHKMCQPTPRKYLLAHVFRAKGKKEEFISMTFY